LRNAFTDTSVKRVVDDVLVEAGAVPVDELCHELRAGSRNGGEIDPTRCSPAGRRTSSGTRASARPAPSACMCAHRCPDR
jgi:hypothetical protein